MMLTDSLISEIASANSSQGEDVWMLNESQLSDFASAVIAANNAKVLKGMEPAFELHWNARGDSRYTVSKPNIGDTVCYSADQVAPLIQRVKELESQLEDAKIEVSNLINN